MDNWTLINQFLLCLIILLPAFLFFLHRRKPISHHRRPPGPPGWPVFGNMFDLGNMPHKTLAGLTKTYGPVLWLRIGAINTMVLQSAEAAAELFKNHDLTFAERSHIEVTKCHNFNKISVALAPHGTYWRVMKRMLTVEMMANQRIGETASLRRKCMDHMISWIHKEADKAGKDSQGIEVLRFLFYASINMMGNLVFSRDLVDPESAEGMEFFSAMVSLTEWAGHPNIVDLFPWLRWLDPQGLRRNTERDMGKTLQVLSKYVQECLKERQLSGQKKKDYLEVLKEFEGDGKEEPVKLSDHDLNILIMEVVMAGSETTSGIVEWAMVELLKNPTTLLILKAELAEVVGRGRRVEEGDLDNLKYLQAVVKETLRMHPLIPFLVPRRAAHDTNFMGYDIPKDTQVFVNAFAIGRDPLIWHEPDCFKPERFLGSNIDFNGQHYELIPFGAGRRICAGIPLAHQMLHLMLGSMVHEFDWSVHESVAHKIRDTREKIGFALRKVEPLIVILRPKVGT